MLKRLFARITLSSFSTVKFLKGRASLACGEASEAAGVFHCNAEYQSMATRFLAISLLFLAVLTGVPRPARSETLPNGFMYTVQRRAESRLVAVDVWVRAGATEERKEEKGCAHFLEHALFKGTARRKPGETDFAIERLGGIWQAATGADYARFYTTVAPAALGEALEVLDDILRNATLPAAEVEKERRVILDELGKYEANSMNRLSARLYQEAFPNHPYQFPPGGTQATIQRLTRDQLLAFYKRNYAPNRCALVLTGEVDKAEGEKAIAKVFGDWKALPVEAEKEPPQSERLSAAFAEMEAPAGEGAVAIGWGAPPAKNAKMAACGKVIAEILGGSEAGRLSVPDLAGASASAQYTPRREPSLLYVLAKAPASAQDFAERLSRIESAVLVAVASLEKRPPGAAELQLAKRQIAIRLRLDAETCAGLSRLIGYADITGGEAPEAFKRTLALLTPQDIQECAAQYLRPHQRVVVRYAPKAAPNPGGSQ